MFQGGIGTACLGITCTRKYGRGVADLRHAQVTGKETYETTVVVAYVFFAKKVRIGSSTPSSSRTIPTR